MKEPGIDGLRLTYIATSLLYTRRCGSLKGRRHMLQWFVSLTVAVAVALGVTAVPASSQFQVVSVEELRRELAPKDVISVVQVSGDVATGQLVRLGDSDFEIRTVTVPSTGQPDLFQTLTIPYGAIRSIERLPDASKNGALIGAGIGAGMTLAMFLYGVAVDRNEMDEWAPLYIPIGGVFAGVGALVGWVADAVHSKPRIRFDLMRAGQTFGPSVSPAPLRLARRVAVGAGFGWGNGLMANLQRGSAYPDGIPGHVAPRTTARSVAAEVVIGRNLSLRGEATWHSPTMVSDKWMELDTDKGTSLPLTDWPRQTSGNERVRWYSWDQRFPYSLSGFVGYHTPMLKRRRADWTLLLGLTMSRSQEDYVEQHYTVIAGVPVPQPTFDVVGAPYTRHETRHYRALALGVDATVTLTDHVAVVPNVRLDLFGVNWARARAGTGIQWTF